jgi:hypothetical protein
MCVLATLLSCAPTRSFGYLIPSQLLQRKYSVYRLNTEKRKCVAFRHRTCFGREETQQIEKDRKLACFCAITGLLADRVHLRVHLGL